MMIQAFAVPEVFLRNAERIPVQFNHLSGPQVIEPGRFYLFNQLPFIDIHVDFFNFGHPFFNLPVFDNGVVKNGHNQLNFSFLLFRTNEVDGVVVNLGVCRKSRITGNGLT